jgi:arginine/lysine/ornithine decarboxylase
MDHSAAPLLDALVDYHVRDRYGFTPPGHRQGRGADPRTRAVLGEDTFRSDVLATAGWMTARLRTATCPGPKS